MQHTELELKVFLLQFKSVIFLRIFKIFRKARASLSERGGRGLIALSDFSEK